MNGRGAKRVRVVVLGAGYVGLATGVTFSYLGHDVVLVDINPERVAAIVAARSPILEPGLDDLLHLTVSSGRLTATTDPEAALSGAEVVFIAVNTPPLPSGDADMSYVRAAATGIGARVDPARRMVVVNKSTVPIGSANLVKSWVEDGYRAAHGGRSPNGAFTVASNPEFLREGQALSDSFYPSRIVLGTDVAWAMATLEQLYEPLIAQKFPPPNSLPRPDRLTIPIPLARVDRVSAEMVKYAANAFLATKISFANEMAAVCERVGADVTKVMAAVGQDERIGPQFLEAGVGWGGSCFGKDLSALIQTAREYGLEPAIAQAAVEVNQRQRRWLVQKLQATLKTIKGRRVAVLGLTFKPGTDDLRDSPAEAVIAELCRLGARVVAHDPVATSLAAHAWSYPVEYVSRVEEALAGAEALLLVTGWPEYHALDWPAVRAEMDRALVLDGRNLWDPDELRQLGLEYYSVGR